jgi:hypothetical protein
MGIITVRGLRKYLGRRVGRIVMRAGRPSKSKYRPMVLKECWFGELIWNKKDGFCLTKCNSGDYSYDVHSDTKIIIRTGCTIRVPCKIGTRSYKVDLRKIRK